MMRFPTSSYLFSQISGPFIKHEQTHSDERLKCTFCCHSEYHFCLVQAWMQAVKSDHVLGIFIGTPPMFELDNQQCTCNKKIKLVLFKHCFFQNEILSFKMHYFPLFQTCVNFINLLSSFAKHSAHLEPLVVTAICNSFSTWEFTECAACHSIQSLEVY